MLSSNKFDKGYQSGFDAAVNGKKKNFANSGNSWQFLLLGENAIDTYNQGYDKGYLDGLRKKSGLFNDDSTDVKENAKIKKRYNPGIRTGDNSFIPTNHRINNIRSIKESIDYLILTYETLNTRLNELKENYQSKLTELNEEGLLDDLHEDLVYEYMLTASDIDNLIYNIESNDISNLKDIKDKVEVFEQLRRQR